MNHPYPLGSVVCKINSMPDDAHKDGALGVLVVAPFAVPTSALTESWYISGDLKDGDGVQFFYFVIWDDSPLTVGVAGHKLEAIQ